MKKIGIISNNENDKAIEVAKECYDYLMQKDIEVYLIEGEVMPERFGLQAISKQEFIEKSQSIVSVGGDGTLLRAAKHIFFKGTPIMGINSGKLGFLTEVDLPHMKKALDDLVAGSFKVEERMLLEAKLLRKDKELLQDENLTALNDITILRSLSGKIIDIVIKIRGVTLLDVRADGVIVSTPTGSTAYSLSAGGPVVEPITDLIIVTPICAHTLYDRSIVLSPSSKVEIQIRTKNEDDSLIVDGVNKKLRLFPEDRFVFYRSPHKLNLITYNKGIFFEVFKRKLLRN